VNKRRHTAIYIVLICLLQVHKAIKDMDLDLDSESRSFSGLGLGLRL